MAKIIKVVKALEQKFVEIEINEKKRAREHEDFKQDRIKRLKREPPLQQIREVENEESEVVELSPMKLRSVVLHPRKHNLRERQHLMHLQSRP